MARYGHYGGDLYGGHEKALGFLELDEDIVYDREVKVELFLQTIGYLVSLIRHRIETVGQKTANSRNNPMM